MNILNRPNLAKFNFREVTTMSSGTLLHNVIMEE